MSDPEIDLERHWWRLNQVFTANDNEGPGDGPEWRIVERDPSLVLTAVHGVRHARPEFNAKLNDANTGGLVLCIAEQLNATSAVVLRSSHAAADPNWTDDHPLKLELAKRGLVGPGVRLIDLHGMRDQADVDIAIGAAFGDNGSADFGHGLANELRRFGLNIDDGGARTGLTARRRGTMTAWAQVLGATAVQIEIARRDRTFKGPPEPRKLLLAALTSSIATSVRR